MNDTVVQKNKNKNKTHSIIIVLLAVLLGIGYAYLQTTLNIFGTTNVDKNSWNIYWTSENASASASPGVIPDPLPGIDKDDPTSINFGLTLTKPGTWAEFVVSAHNEGSLDAMIDDISLLINGSDDIPEYLNVSLTYSDDVYLLEKQILRHNSSEMYKFRIEYNADIDEEILDLVPADPLEISIGIKYVQADQTAVEVRNYVYSTYDGSDIPVDETSDMPESLFVLGYPISEALEEYVYDTESEALNHTEHLTLLKHVVSGNNVALTYVGFTYNNTMYYLQPGKNNYEANVAYLESLMNPTHDPDWEGCFSVHGDDAVNHYVTQCGFDGILLLLDNTGRVLVVDDFDTFYGCAGDGEISLCTKHLIG